MEEVKAIKALLSFVVRLEAVLPKILTLKNNVSPPPLSIPVYTIQNKSDKQSHSFFFLSSISQISLTIHKTKPPEADITIRERAKAWSL